MLFVHRLSHLLMLLILTDNCDLLWLILLILSKIDEVYELLVLIKPTIEDAVL